MATYVMEPVDPDKSSGKQYTITATATALSSSGILNSRYPVKKLTVKNADGAANACYLGPATVTNAPANADVELGAGDSYTYHNVSPGEIYIVGTANAANIAFVKAEYKD